MKKVIYLLMALVLSLSVFTACGAQLDSQEDDGKFRIVTTTSMLADMSRVIGGDSVVVEGLMGPGIDPHLYKASAGDIRDLATYIADNEIKAVFVESSVPKKNIEALQEAVAAQGFNVEIGGELYSDSLGSPGTSAETYIGTVKANVDTIVDALK
jgi:ABC-type Zn uptake system ZnuABC Zn-binding protein ZnuA